MRIARLTIALLALGLGACAGPEVRQERSGSASAAAMGPAADDKLDAVSWTQTAAEFRATSLQAFTGAWRAVDAGLADPAWDALPSGERDTLGNRGVMASLPVAVIADVDETLLDNTPFNARLIVDPFPGDLPTSDSRAAFALRWKSWVAEERAHALPGAVAFAKRLSDHGVALYYVTNRDDDEREATCRNLVATGFPVPDCETFVLTRNDAAGRPSAKLTRRATVGRTHRVVAMLGDNLGDFVDGVDANRSVREGLVDRHAGWWGERWWVLPNPIYGSWENAAGPLPSGAVPATLRERSQAIRKAKISELDLRM